MRLRALASPARSVSRSTARKMGGAGSLADAMAGKAGGSKLARYTQKNEHPCASCTKGKHQCTSIHCPCERCNPEVL